MIRLIFAITSILMLSSLTSCQEAPRAQGGLTDLPSTLPNLGLLAQATPIAEIHEASADDTMITLEGVVQQQAPLVGGWLYEIQDETGRIWVMTAGAAPAPGDTVKVRGYVHYESVPVGNTDLGERYVEEIEQIR